MKQQSVHFAVLKRSISQFKTASRSSIFRLGVSLTNPPAFGLFLWFGGSGAPSQDGPSAALASGSIPPTSSASTPPTPSSAAWAAAWPWPLRPRRVARRPGGAANWEWSLVVSKWGRDLSPKPPKPLDAPFISPGISAILYSISSSYIELTIVLAQLWIFTWFYGDLGMVYSPSHRHIVMAGDGANGIVVATLEVENLWPRKIICRWLIFHICNRLGSAI